MPVRLGSELLSLPWRRRCSLFCVYWQSLRDQNMFWRTPDVVRRSFEPKAVVILSLSRRGSNMIKKISRKAPLFMAACLAFALVLAGCGGTGSPASNGTSNPPPTPTGCGCWAYGEGMCGCPANCLDDGGVCLNPQHPCCN